MDFEALFLSLKLAFTTTIFLLPLACLVAWFLRIKQGKLAMIVKTIAMLPLVLPPTVLGFYLLLLFGSNGALGSFNLAFTFTGLVIGSIIYSFPFALQPIQTAFSAIKEEYLEVASTLGANKIKIFFRVILPEARAGIAAAAVLSFAHTLGEFGVVLMIGGSIPGETKTASIAIFEQVEQLNYNQAHTTALVLLGISLVILLLFNALTKKK